MFLNALVVSNGFLFALKALLVELEVTEKLFIYSDVFGFPWLIKWQLGSTTRTISFNLEK